MSPALGTLASRTALLRWKLVYDGGKWLFEHGRRFWGNLSQDERSDLGRLIKASKGRRTNLSDPEYERLKLLVKRGFTGSG
ncbi:MAG: hypothetical protein GEU88_09210 [Solirubrobacterales bacterium]|nr:hypothetical protein [Solirubrobacterales bacterium]